MPVDGEPRTNDIRADTARLLPTEVFFSTAEHRRGIGRFGARREGALQELISREEPQTRSRISYRGERAPRVPIARRTVQKYRDSSGSFVPVPQRCLIVRQPSRPEESAWNHVSIRHGECRTASKIMSSGGRRSFEDFERWSRPTHLAQAVTGTSRR